MLNKKAIIVWVEWQDGKIMRDKLVLSWYSIVWIWRLRTIYHNFNHNQNIDILDYMSVSKLIEILRPNEIYYLAAYHHSSQDQILDDNLLYKRSLGINVEWYLNFLNAINNIYPETKILYASSCLIYSSTDTTQQDEFTLHSPNSIYAITKIQWMHLGNYFYEKYWIKAVNAILYNHESEYRSSKFVSMKIIQWAVNIKKWLQNSIILWDINSRVDWWHARDYVNAMNMLLDNSNIWDYIISSWNLHSIEDMISLVFGYLELDWKQYVYLDSNIITRKNWILFGNNSKIIRDTNWAQAFNFKNMIIDIIEKVIKNV